MEQASLDRRRELLRQIKLSLPGSAPWEAWLKRTGELPPDFSQMPSQADLPDPLAFTDGSRVTDAAGWQRRRGELLDQFHHWFWGSVPPAPDNLQAEVLEEQKLEACTIRKIRLSFGPDHKALLRFELLIPEGKGPFPVLLTQGNHRMWGQLAVSRGYVACVYNANDGTDDTDTFVSVYPEVDWSRLTRRAWAASRVVDYLLTQPQLISPKQIAIAGHSRNGKQSLIAGASDERFAVIISSSSGQGGAASTRFQAEPQATESIEGITRNFPEWFHPRARFFAGNEQKLPIDFHEDVALCAPRAVLLSTALNDPSELAWAVQQTYLAVQPTYALLKAPDKLRLMPRTGAHEHNAETVSRYLDFCDEQFGRPSVHHPSQLPFPHNYAAWQKHNTPASRPATAPTTTVAKTSQEWEKQRERVRDRIVAMLGREPSEAPATQPGTAYGHEPTHIAELFRRNEDSYLADLARRHQTSDALDRDPITFGDDLSGDVYLPQGLRGSGKRAPAVLWLHPFSYSKGYNSSSGRSDAFFRNLAQRGFVVLCFDQIGTGSRVAEGEHFYDRYPHWSLLGKMVRDSQAGLDALAARSYVDPNQIYVVGYSLGAFVGLHVAAIDQRLAGAAFACPPPPFRTDTDINETGGLARWSARTLLLPQLGTYIGHESQVPYDLDDLLACFAPKPVLIVTPEHDRHAPLAKVTPAIDHARKTYDLYQRGELLIHKTPDTINTFDTQTQTSIIQWLSFRAGQQPTTAPAVDH